mmetsp:Transcript_24459/g.28184  ORF Transcript_24459/g.28184 Transcript_24459/m.28184 type:complete len:127 (+) Transcript_24459:43-423(+)
MFIMTAIIFYAQRYGFAMVGSTVTNSFLVNKRIPKDVAFVISIYGFSIVNYFILNWLAKRAKEKCDIEPTSHDVENKLISRGGALPFSRKNDIALFQRRGVVAQKDLTFDTASRFRSQRRNQLELY